ncbi:MAG: restriction endonuclease subunit S [Lachnospiraceae bacterium oral taxon 082]|nr:restriction endonuclease subunit S [Lachnospiraceae bacterium oral taxon 082]
MSRVPRIRFKGFEEDWEQRKLSSIAEEITRTDPESTAPVMMITANNGFIEQSDRYAFNNAGKSLKKYILLEKSEMAYNHGASKLRPYGSCFALTTAEIARIPFVYHCFSVGDNDPEFVSMELNGTRVEHQLRKIVSSGARMDGLLNISYEEYASVELMMPCIPEQHILADYFRRLNHLITLHQRKLEKLKIIKKSMLENLFPQNGEKTPKIRFSGFTKDWEQCKLGEVFNFYYGVGNNNPSNGGQYPVFGAGGIQGGYTKYNAENSIIIGHMGDAGCVSWGEGKHFVTYNGTITKPKDDVFSAKFGYYLLLNMNLRKYRGGSGLPFLTYDMLTEMETKRPNSRFETQKIANYFSYLDHLITLHQSKLEKLQKIKKSMLESMFV